jgi:Mlc titration factor MtfA (ptsG expression regulator)
MVRNLIARLFYKLNALTVRLDRPDAATRVTAWDVDQSLVPRDLMAGALAEYAPFYARLGDDDKGRLIEKTYGFMTEKEFRFSSDFSKDPALTKLLVSAIAGHLLLGAQDDLLSQIKIIFVSENAYLHDADETKPASLGMAQTNLYQFMGRFVIRSAYRLLPDLIANLLHFPKSPSMDKESRKKLERLQSYLEPIALELQTKRGSRLEIKDMAIVLKRFLAVVGGGTTIDPMVSQIVDSFRPISEAIDKLEDQPSSSIHLTHNSIIQSMYLPGTMYANTVVHELAHCVDFKYEVSVYDPEDSDLESPTWVGAWRKAIDALPLRTGIRLNKDEVSQRREKFAQACALYFSSPDQLKSHDPAMCDAAMRLLGRRPPTLPNNFWKYVLSSATVQKIRVG